MEFSSSTNHVPYVVKMIWMERPLVALMQPSVPTTSSSSILQQHQKHHRHQQHSHQQQHHPHYGKHHHPVRHRYPNLFFFAFHYQSDCFGGERWPMVALPWDTWWILTSAAVAPDCGPVWGWGGAECSDAGGSVAWLVWCRMPRFHRVRIWRWPQIT